MVQARHIIYLALTVLIAIPLISPLGLPVTVTRYTVDMYDAIEALPRGSAVGASISWGSANWPETGPQMTAILQHLFRKPVRIVLASWTVEGPMLFERILSNIDKGEKKYGDDYVLLPYIPGIETAFAAYAADIVAASGGVDYYGKRLSELSAVKGVKTIDDLAYQIFTTNTSIDGEMRQWSRFKVKLGVALLGGSVPGAMPYVVSGRIVGMINGIRGAAEYELLLKKPGLGLKSTDAVSLTHVLALALIVAGNVVYFGRRRKWIQ